MKNWITYRQKTYTQDEARRMDYELAILRNLIIKMKDDKRWIGKIRIAVAKIRDRVYKNENYENL